MVKGAVTVRLSLSQIPALPRRRFFQALMLQADRVEMLTWLNVDQLNRALLPPTQEVLAGQLWSVVAANRFRFSPTIDHAFQRPRHSAA